MPPQTNNIDSIPDDKQATGQPVAALDGIENNRKHDKKPLILGGLLLVLIGLSILTLNIQNISDWYRLRQFKPPAAIASLVTQDTMTPYARKIFYINAPTLDSKAVFNKACPNSDSEDSIILGCYHGYEGGIDLLSVTDPVLNGVEQVTAAHEMLHGAYARLSSSEKTKVDAMLNNYYEHDLSDPRVKAEVAIYQKTEPHSVMDEMHSTFGTEIANLPAPLEAYYKTLFTNRGAIVGFANQYEGELTSRQNTVKQDDAELASMKSEIIADEADLKTKSASIDTQQQTLNAERSSNPAAYNQAVPGFNNQVDDYNGEVQIVQGLVGQYNDLVATRNQTASQVSELIDNLTDTVTPISN